MKHGNDWRTRLACWLWGHAWSPHVLSGGFVVVEKCARCMHERDVRP